MNRFSKENFTGDPPWVGDPDYGKSPYNSEQGYSDFEMKLEYLINDLGEDLAEEWWNNQKFNNEPTFNSENSKQEEKDAIDNWVSVWWDSKGKQYLEQWSKDNFKHFFEEWHEDLADYTYDWLKDKAKPDFDKWYNKAFYTYYQL